LIEVLPGKNGMRFRKVFSEYDNRVGLFFIVTDSSINVRPQGIKMNFKSVGIETAMVDDFAEKIKTVLNGKFRALINEVDIKKFRKVINEFLYQIDQQDILL